MKCLIICILSFSTAFGISFLNRNRALAVGSAEPTDTGKTEESQVELAKNELRRFVGRKISQRELPDLISEVKDLYRFNPGAIFELIDELPQSERLRAVVELGRLGDGDDRLIVYMSALDRGYVDDESDPELAREVLRGAANEFPFRYASWVEKFAQKVDPNFLLDTITFPHPAHTDLLGPVFDICLSAIEKSGRPLSESQFLRVSTGLMGVKDPSHETIKSILELPGKRPAWLDQMWISRLSTSQTVELLRGDLVTEPEQRFGLINRAGDDPAILASLLADPKRLSESEVLELEKIDLVRKFRSDEAGATTTRIVDFFRENPTLEGDEGTYQWFGENILIRTEDPVAELNDLARSGLPGGPEIIASAIAKWAETDVVEASAALASMENPPDGAIVAVIDEIAGDPSAAALWAAEIRDPTLRTQLIDRYIEQVEEEDPELARELRRKL